MSKRKLSNEDLHFTDEYSSDESEIVNDRRTTTVEEAMHWRGLKYPYKAESHQVGKRLKLFLEFHELQKQKKPDPDGDAKHADAEETDAEETSAEDMDEEVTDDTDAEDADAEDSDVEEFVVRLKNLRMQSTSKS